MFEKAIDSVEAADNYQAGDSAQRIADRRNLWIDPEEIGLEERRGIIRRREERERWEGFAQYVRSRRLAVGRSQTECAKMAGLTQTKWTRMESAQYTVPIGMIPGIAAALDFDLDGVYRAAGFAVPETAPAKKDRKRTSAKAKTVTGQEIEVMREQLDRIESMLAELLSAAKGSQVP